MNILLTELGYLAPLVITLYMAVWGTLGFIIMARFVEIENNRGFLLGGLVGFFVFLLVSAFIDSHEFGIWSLLLCGVYAYLVVREECRVWPSIRKPRLPVCWS